MVSADAQYNSLMLTHLEYYIAVASRLSLHVVYTQDALRSALKTTQGE